MIHDFSGELASPRICWVVEPFATSRGTLCSLQQGQEHVGSYPLLSYWEFELIRRHLMIKFRPQGINREAASTGFDSFGQQNTSSIDSRETNTGNLGFSTRGGSSECSPSQGTIQCIRCCHAYIASRTQALRPFLFRLFYIVEPRVFRYS